MKQLILLILCIFLPGHDFYSFNVRYIDDDVTQEWVTWSEELPAHLAGHPVLEAQRPDDDDDDKYLPHQRHRYKRDIIDTDLLGPFGCVPRDALVTSGQAITAATVPSELPARTCRAGSPVNTDPSPCCSTSRAGTAAPRKPRR